MTDSFWTLDKNAHKTRIRLLGETLRGLAMGIRSLQNFQEDLVYALSPPGISCPSMSQRCSLLAEKIVA